MIKEPIDTNDDKPFSWEQIVFVIKINPKKAPGEDGLTSEIILHVFRSFPSFLRCTKNALKAVFRNRKKSSIVPIILVKQGRVR